MLQDSFHISLSSIPDFTRKHFLVSVSGGLDSMVLLHLFQQTRRQFPSLQLSVFHFNHLTRPGENDAEWNLVDSFCKKNSIPFYSEIWQEKPETGNFQDEARKARSIRLNVLAEKINTDFICTAHHADDQLETILYRLFTGASLTNLKSMSFRDGNRIHPLIGNTRKELQVWAEKHGVLWLEDSSNASDHYERNRIRHQFIPVLETLFGSRWRASLLLLASQSEQVSAVLNQSYPTWKNSSVHDDPSGLKIEFDGNSLYNEVFYTFYLERLLSELTGSSFGWKRANELVTWLKSGKRRKSVSGIFSAERTQGGFILIRTDNIPPEKNWKLTIESSEKPKVWPEQQLFIYADGDNVIQPLTIRTWKNGDRFQPVGMEKPVKLSDFFINRKVPLGKKHQLPLVCDSNGQIIWVGGLELCESIKVTSSATSIIKLTLAPHEKN